MVESKLDVHWAEIKKLLFECKENDQLFCPLSPEHYLETSQKKIEDAKLHDDFLYSLSEGYSFKPDLFITSQLISSKIRRNNITLKTYMYENIGNVFNKKSNYDNFKKTRNEHGKLIRDATLDLNVIRSNTHAQKIDQKTKGQFIKTLKILQTKSFIERLQELEKKEKVFIRGDQIGDQEVPNWVDLIIDQLLKKHKLTKKEISKLITEFKSNGFKNIPTLNIRTTLLAYMSAYSKKEHPNDHIDIMRISVGLPISDILLTDKKRKAEIIESGLDKIYNTKVFSGTAPDLVKLISELKKMKMNL